MPSNQTELSLRLRQQALLAELGRLALSSVPLDTLMEEVCRVAAIGLNIRFSKVLEYLPSQNRFLVRAGTGWHPGVVGHATFDADHASPAGYALLTGKPAVSNHLATEQRFNTPEILREHGIQRAANVILITKDQPFGVLEVDSEESGTFTPHDLDFLEAAANLLALAMERRRAEDELRGLNEGLEQRIEHEVAERRQAENALRQTQKMEAIGQLTGGVAHDFNNLLTVVSGSLELLAHAVPDNPRAQQLIANARKAAARGAQLTGQLLTFARRHALQPESRLVNDLVREFESLLPRLLSEAIDIEFALDPAAGACHVDPAQFGSALLNLAVNARDAMPSGGRLAVRTGTLLLDETAAKRYPDARAGTYVTVEVGDTGTGVPPEIVERVTEPFFTTKPPGEGTGLGLSQVHGFVRQSGGFMTLESSVGRGTTVRLHFPLRAAATVAAAADAAPAGGSGTVLVVEDDADVRDLLVALIADLGYSTRAAANGPEALSMLRQAANRVDVLLTDMVMPGGMSGPDLVREARALRPGLPAVLTSGYVAGQAHRPQQADHQMDLPVLLKPYHQEELARVIAQALHRA